MKRLLLLFVVLLVTTISAQNYNYLGTFDSQGVPDYLVENDYISQALLDSINNALPESYPVPDYNPHYISSGYDTDVILVEDAEIWVTFVGEGAGYKNTLGFYTYDINNPPSTAPSAEEITIIFPNVSKVNSGGGLVIGNKVKIGSFTANTGIGWVLLANAWSNGSIGSGHWQLFSNPDYNPENDPELRHHNVLLSDPENQRIILGFEDIRRDYGSCDNDFNDALFYVTANPFSAIKTENFADIKSATDVSSANDGGLESNGKLANLIAQRNFNRTKNNSFLNQKNLQPKYNRQSIYKTTSGVDFSKYFPQTGFYGSETAYVSSPEDLMSITNAEGVFSVDYYNDSLRASAGLALHTKETVYNHTKTICDRLNGSLIEDIRTVKVQGYELVLARILRASGAREYAIHFSVKKDSIQNELYSLWNIDAYPDGEYYNFQLWGNTVPQVAHLVKNVLNALKKEKTLIATSDRQKIPSVFIQKGYYKNGTLHLDVVNKTGEMQLSLAGNLRETETSAERAIDSIIPLSGKYKESLEIKTGSLFDIGLSIVSLSSDISDQMYIADGPWGLDYLDKGADIVDFKVEKSLDSILSDEFKAERNVMVSGHIKETLNVFRTLLPGDQFKDISEFKYLQFDLKSDMPVEVILVTEHLDNWENRLRFKINDTASAIKTRSIAISDFLNYQEAKHIKIKSIVFSIQGDYSNYKDFSLSISDLKFTNNQLSDTDQNIASGVDKAYNYPNPFRFSTTIVAPAQEKITSLKIYNIKGQLVREYRNINKLKNITILRDNLNSGMYTYLMGTDKSLFYSGKLIVN